MLEKGERIVALKDNNHYYSAGDKGVILSADTVDYRVKFDKDSGNDDTWFIPHEDCKPADKLRQPNDMVEFKCPGCSKVYSESLAELEGYKWYTCVLPSCSHPIDMDAVLGRASEMPEEPAVLAPKPTGNAFKMDSEKNKLDLLPIYPMELTGQVLTFGAKKYAARAWEEGMDWSRVYGALLRHIFAWWRGEDNDPETGLSHLGHALCCLMFLAEYTRTKAGVDDRPKNK